MKDPALQPKSFDPSAVGVLAWRRRRLQRAGFDAQLAEKLSSDRSFDLHAILELTDRGCPPELAARILAPLDDSPERTL